MRRHHHSKLLVRSTFLALVVLAFGLAPSSPSAAAGPDPYWQPQTISVYGDHIALVGDFNLDPADDVFWYSPGSTLDPLWLGREGRRDASAFWTFSFNIKGRYEPFVGDFAGDESDDILWYAPGPAADVMWVGARELAASFSATYVDQKGTFQPIVLHDRTGGKDDILWYAPGTAADELWVESDGDAKPEQRLPLRIDGSYQPFAGDFDGNGFEEPFFYAPGPTADYEWRANGDGTFRSFRRAVSGTYQPLTNSHWLGDGKTYDDIVWIGASSGSLWNNYLGHWYPQAFGGWPGRATAIDESGNSGYDVALWGRPGTERSIDTSALDNGFLPLSPTGLDVDNRNLAVGDFDADGLSDLLWWTPGAATDAVWYGEPIPES